MVNQKNVSMSCLTRSNTVNTVLTLIESVGIAALVVTSSTVLTLTESVGIAALVVTFHLVVNFITIL